ncbi:MAG TPA: LysR family transcriptional regulator [Candidatus Lachnoclostridium pullistercoris]|uniref:LysR family transcriptional regulator n=1 Tax=Candidatus Lachnoclostridium pullistercoris TaxID=2838632 RepID=A0A9D2T8A9_9FIRM|nr:LysR family transcriptional regulator [Candidatus Lachnoclostridium pullistercoris]
MDTRYLTYILTIAEERNMTKAAKKLFVSQSSLSQYLTKLEQELGTPLFFRTKGELILTPAGELYTEAARNVIRIKKQLYRDIASLENRGHVTITVTSQFGLQTLTDVIPRFKAIYPDYRIEITEQSLPSATRMLLEENLDLGLLAANAVEPFSPENVRVLCREEVLFAVPASHPFVKKNPSGTIARKDIKTIFQNENFLLSRRGSTLRTLTDQLFEELDFSPTILCETNSVTATLRMAAEGIGVTFIGRSCENPDLSAVCYRLSPPLFRLNLLVRRKNWVLNPAETYLCRLIGSCFPQPDTQSEDSFRNPPPPAPSAPECGNI